MNFTHMMQRRMEEAGGNPAPGGAPAPTPAPAGGAPAPAPTPTPAPAAPASLLATGAGEPQPPTEFIPEKLRVNKEDGSFDLEASSRKVAEAYSALEKRLGTSEAPPKSAADYAVTVPDALKEVFDPATDQGMQDFMGKAHAAGMTQAQLDLVMSQYFEMAPALAAGAAQYDVNTAKAELQKVWNNDADFNRNVRNAYQGAEVAAKKAGLDINEIMNSPIASNPTFMRMMAAIGPEFQEDPGAGGAAPIGSANVDDLMRSAAYMDPKHQDHAKVSQQVRDYYARKHGTHAAG